MKRFFLTLFVAICATAASAQTGIGGAYEEPADGYAYNRTTWNALDNAFYASWSSRDAHYLKYEAPAISVCTDTTIYAWRGERVGASALLFSKLAASNLSLSTSDLRTLDGAYAIEASRITARFVRYVLSDEKKGCGENPRTSPTLLRPDVIDTETTLSLPARSVRPLWVTIEVPADAHPGTYFTTLTIEGEQSGELHEELYLRVQVSERTLPEPSQWGFWLDYWQQPFSVARYYQVEPWSEAHFAALRPFMEMLRRAGQRCVTATLFYEPWGEQSNDAHEAMVGVTKKADGTWHYDYTVFDRWVDFASECGISEQINCYSMIPWNKTFRYHDERSGKDLDLVCEVGSEEYVALWRPFLTAFAEHLRAKGWFEKTCIAMDERGLEDMIKAYDLLQATVPGMKMVLAGNHHEELADKLADYSIASGQSFSAGELAARRAAGWHSTVYYCCSEHEPNTLTNSLPAEAAYWPLYSIANGFDGLLHWSFIDWTDDPLRDSRFKLFPPGDTYLVYPGPRSSVRYERLLEGIQATEKIRRLRAAYDATGDTSSLTMLDTLLSPFATGVMPSYEEMTHHLHALQKWLNQTAP